MKKMNILNTEDTRKYLQELNFPDLIIWMKNNWNIYPKFHNDILERVKQLHIRISPRNINECNCNTVESFYDAIMLAPIFNEQHYELLNTMTNTVIFPIYGQVWDGISGESISPDSRIVMMALLDRSSIEKGRVACFEDELYRTLYLFLSRIVDIYIPTHNPDALVRSVLSCIHNSLAQIIHEYPFSDKIVETFKANEYAYVSLKEFMLLFKIVGSIYDNSESSFEFIQKYHTFVNTKLFTRHEVEKIEHKYRRYMEPGTITENFIFCIFTLFERGYAHVKAKDPTELQYNIDNFLEEFSYEFKKKLSMAQMQVLLLEIGNIIASNDRYDMRKDAVFFITKEILKGWQSNKYNTPFILDVDIEDYSADDKPISTLEAINRLAELDIATEAKEMSAKMNNAEKKIYKAYRTYKENEEKVDSQITKGVMGLKKVVTGDVRETIIEGKKFSAIGMLKKLLAGVALFSFGPIKAVIALVIRYALKKKTTDSERSKILMEIDTEIAMLDEKIKDARGDNNREAKYAMMRTKKELENAKSRINYGMSADTGSLQKTKKTLDESRRDRGVV